jgi:hypothetical protein
MNNLYITRDNCPPEHGVQIVQVARMVDTVCIRLNAPSPSDDSCQALTDSINFGFDAMSNNVYFDPFIFQRTWCQGGFLPRMVTWCKSCT